MSEELKTLKDLPYHIVEDFELEKEASVIDIDILKAEAVKWVKDNRRMKRYDLAQIFMIFFNITEDDLTMKGGKKDD